MFRKVGVATFKSLLVHASRLNAADRFSYSPFSAGLRQRTFKAAEFRYLSANATSSRSECRYRSFIAAECRQHPRNTAQFRSLPLNAEGCRWSPLNSARRVRYRSFPLGLLGHDIHILLLHARLLKSGAIMAWMLGRHTRGFQSR